MKKILAQSVLVANTLANSQAPELTAGQSFPLNVTISNYMPNLWLGAGENNQGFANQKPMLISLLGPASWVWSTNCTNSVPGAQGTNCSASPLYLDPSFN